jgi:arylsulfatase
MPPASRTSFRARALAACALLLVASAAVQGAGTNAGPGKRDSGRPPNIVLIYCDDLGYADVGCFGAPSGIETPHIDRLAREGIRFTSFRVAQAVCSASRAALLTGCYPNRVGIAGALDHRARIGLNPGETTMAEVLKPRGYATAIVGKWHLGHRPEFLPTRQGFDEWLGLPYSNDMWPFHPEAKPGSYPDLPLYDGEQIIDPAVTPATQSTLTTRYTERAVRFIERHAAEPFFLYVAHSMPHVPLHVSEARRGTSSKGLFGDVIREIDDSVGAILGALERHQLEKETLVVFTSDNGPWLSYGDHAGSAGPLREGKGTSWEGGVRVPFVARWPGHIRAGRVCSEPAMTIDLLPTFARLAGATLPARKIDGLDLWPLLSGKRSARSPHEAYWIYYNQNELQAVVSGDWKLVLPHTYRTLAAGAPATGGIPTRYTQVQTGLGLYHLKNDPGETRNLADAKPSVLARLQRLAEAARADLGDALTKRTATGARPVGRVD